jgi:uncharacterized cupin superfamily protein
VDGPFVGSVDAAEGWSPTDFDGQTIGEAVFVRGDETDGGAYFCGVWRVPAGELPPSFRYDPEQNETIYVVDGRVSIAVEGGPTLELAAGDVASFRAGSRCRWTIREVPFREVFVLS